MAFATLGLVQLVHSLNARSNEKSLFSIGVFTNRYLIGAILISAIMQVAVIVIPFLNTIFKVVQLGMNQWMVVIVASFVIIPLVEVAKIVLKRFVREKF